MTPPNCPECGLPMSIWDDDDDGPVRWYCDGPNDNTAESGCFHEMPAEPLKSDPDPADTRSMTTTLAPATVDPWVCPETGGEHAFDDSDPTGRGGRPCCGNCGQVAPDVERVPR